MEEIQNILALLKTPDDIKEEIITLYNAVFGLHRSRSDGSSIRLSENTISYIHEKLKYKPFYTNVLIQRLLCLWNSEFKETDNILEDIYITVIENLIKDYENALVDGDVYITDKILSLLSQIHLSEEKIIKFNNTIIPILVNLIKSKNTVKHYIYLSLLAQQKPQILNNIIDIEKSLHTSTDWSDHGSVFLNSIQNNQHWLLDCLDSFNLNEDVFDKPYLRQNMVIILKIFFLTTQSNLNVNQVKELLLSKKSLCDDVFIKRYLTEVERLLKIVDFCVECGCSKQSNIQSIFEFLMKNSCLSTLARFIDISKENNHSSIISILTENITFIKKLFENSEHQFNYEWELETYNSYSILIKIINVILTSNVNCTEKYYSEATLQLVDVFSKICDIESIEKQIEILENIFSLLFLRYEFFNETDDIEGIATYNRPKKMRSVTNYGFICNNLIVRDILNLLKTVTVETQVKLSNLIKNEETKEKDFTETRTKLQNILKFITDGLWRLQLLTTETFYKSIGTFETNIELTFSNLIEIPKATTGLYTEEESSVSESENKTNDSLEKSRDRLSSMNSSESSRSLKNQAVKRRRSDTEKSSEGSESTSSNFRHRNRRQNSCAETDLVQKSSQQLLNYMLSSPRTLICLCLELSDFIKIGQIIQMYGLEDTAIAHEVNFTKNLLDLRSKLKTYFDKLITSSISSSPEKSTLENIKQVTDSAIVASYVINITEKFFNENNIAENNEHQSVIKQYSTVYPHMKNYLKKEMFMNFFDLALTLGNTNKHSVTLLNCAERHDHNFEYNSDYKNFYENVVQCFYDAVVKMNEETVNLSLVDILNNYKFGLNSKVLMQKLTFQEKLAQKLNTFNELIKAETALFDQSGHKVYLKLIQCICDLQKNTSGVGINYMHRIYTYTKILSNLFKESFINMGLFRIHSYFDILALKRTDLIGELVFKLKCVSPVDIEDLFASIDLDLVYHIMLSCCNKIDCKTERQTYFYNISDKQVSLKNFLSILFENIVITPETSTVFHPNEKVYTYVYKNNWVLAYVLKAFYPNLDETKKHIFVSAKCAFLDNFFDAERARALKPMFNDISAMAVMEYIIPLNILFPHLNKLVQQYDTNTIIFKDIFNIIDNLPEIQSKDNTYIQQINDIIMYTLSCNTSISESWKFSELIIDITFRIQSVLENIKYWPGNICVEVLNDLLTLYKGVTINEKAELSKWLMKVSLYEEICENTRYDTWYEIYKRSEIDENNIDYESYYEVSEHNDYDPASILKALIDLKLINISLKWLNLHKITSEIYELIDENYILLIFQNHPQDFEIIGKIFDQLPKRQSVKIASSLVQSIRDIKQLEFLTDYLIANDYSEPVLYEKIKIGIKLAEIMTPAEREKIIQTISEPTLILEQLVMNTRLKRLQQAIKVVHNNVLNERNCDIVTVLKWKIDDMLRCYAQKALDFRIIIQDSSSSSSKSFNDNKLMQSIDEINFAPDRSSTTMPEEAPDKSQWVQNHEASECMCCRNVTFSMFNRRHHCRRCGRVVCAACSTKRLKIPLYGDVLVRACEQCYELTMVQQLNIPTKSDTSRVLESNSSDILPDFWQLTGNLTHDLIIREEFSYEHAPSVSLCLAILNLHTENEELAKFLSNQCNSLMRLIGSIKPNNQNHEIDYNMVIQMLRSLLLAAKVACTRCSLETGLMQCDRLLSQADLLSMLANYNCLDLLPSGQDILRMPSFTLSEPLDGLGLRRIRDKLIEKEMWDLALEVSTKSGLDKNGVFAAWGKTCLKAGSLQLAREKFKHCLEGLIDDEPLPSTSQENTLHPVLRHSGSRQLTISSSNSSSRSIKSSSLVNEIINLLESFSCKIDSAIVKRNDEEKKQKKGSTNSSISSISPQDSALLIINRLANLKNITHGQYNLIYPDGLTKIRGQKSMKSSESETLYMDKIYYDECLYYLQTYGSPFNIIQFYLRHYKIKCALLYIRNNKLDTEMYVEVYMNCLKTGRIEDFYRILLEDDDSLQIWTTCLTRVCQHLERAGLLNTLYQLQQWIGDKLRAAMTCIKFYQRGANTYSDLFSNIEHLHAAQNHLKQELESCQITQTDSPGSKLNTSPREQSHPLILKMDPRDIDKHINTIWRQLEVTRFLTECESSGKKTLQLLPSIFDFGKTPKKEISENMIPTLFGNKIEKIQLAALIIISGGNVEDGFGISFRIIQDYQLNPTKIFCIVARYLASTRRYSDIEKLIMCIRTSGVSEQTMVAMCDEVLLLVVTTITNLDGTGRNEVILDNIIKLINDVGNKISAHIECKQLKSAYLLAARFDRVRDIKKILREAERSNQAQIRAICIKRLSQYQSEK